MKRQLKFALGLSAVIVASQAVAAEIVFYEGEGFRGRVFDTDRTVRNFNQVGFNDRASSVTVESGKWQACDGEGFSGHCVILRPGSYDSLERMGMNNRISSAQPLNHNHHYSNNDQYEPEPLAAPTYEYRRRPSEQLIEVPITSVRAVIGSPEQRCWVEREQVGESDRRNPNVGGAVAGAIIGGVLGHQIGDGHGRDIATVGGAIAGGAIGANVGHNQHDSYERDVRRCETVAVGPPEYWDVTYEYRGQEHRVQLSHAPRDTITINRNGEPRV